MTYRAEPQRSPGKHACAVLAISVGQDYHEGDKLKACLEWASKRFQKLVVFIGDTSQHYHMQAGGMPESDAKAIARAQGSLWLARNGDVLENYGPQVIHWDELKQSADYPLILQKFGCLIDNSILGITVEQDIHRFLKSHISNLKAYQLCKEFLQEELAIHTVLGRHYPGVYLYPGSQLKSEELIRSGMLHEAPSGIEQQVFCQLNLKSREPQNKKSNEVMAA